MKKILIYTSFVLAAFFASLLEVILLNNPFGIFQHVRIVLIFYIITLLLSSDVHILYTLPLPSYFLEQYSALPFGAITVSLFVALGITAAILKLLITNRSFTAISLISITTVILYRGGIYIISIANNSFIEPGSLWYFTKSSALTFTFDAISALAVVSFLYFGITRFSKRWNPRYVIQKKNW